MSGELASLEAAYEASVKSNVHDATTGFIDRYVRMLTFKGDSSALLLQLPNEIEERAQAIAKESSCDVGDVPEA